MTRFSSELLDLSRLPPPDAIRNVDYEVIMAERRAALVAEFAARGIEYDADGLETDLSMVLQGIDGERETFNLEAINSATRAVMVAFATGSNLDHLGASAVPPVARLDGESDARFRRRIILAPDAYGTAGSEGGYVYRALTADPRVIDAVALGPGSLNLRPGQVRVAIAVEEDAADVLDIVTRKLFSKDVKPLTDMLSVKVATPVRYAIAGTVEISRGPDPAMVKTEAARRLNEYLLQRRNIGSVIALSGLSAALHVGTAERVVMVAPTADVDPGADGLAVCTAINITTSIRGTGW